ncbi:MAG: SDR family oxidoreductase [Deltaproteobacteria bacterium]|nr:SDR family oxidoreductase [Deltaproteobacteria bacterium]
MNYPIFSLSGKKALVTGGTRGIGRALALGLAQAGAAVAVIGQNETLLKKVNDEIQALDRKSYYRVMNVRNLASIQSGVEDCRQALGGLDILINNAGFEQVCDSLEVDSAIWDSILDTNLKGAFFCAQAAGRIMSDSGGGTIVNVCSLSSSVGIPKALPYTCSKSALLGMTRGLSSEWSPKKIRVNAIAPGYFWTDLTDDLFQNETWKKNMIVKIPMRRFGHVQDLIGVTVFLCSQASEYISGQMITIDGGYLAPI